jgi:AmmeMemoRadiSam system protein A
MTASLAMVPMPLSESQRSLLLDTARGSIEYGLDHGRAQPVVADRHQPLDAAGASFVTLHSNGELRGCIGSLEAWRPLLLDVSENAFAAAFRDPRFAPLRTAEFGGLSVDISVLSEPEPLDFESREELLDRIQPGIDGLILQDGDRRGTFLPSVWSSLPDKDDFLKHLALKAGLAASHWSDTLRVWRYTTESFGDNY